MKRQVSVLYLAARTSLPWVLAILVLMALIQGGMAFLALEQGWVDLAMVLDRWMYRWTGAVALTLAMAAVIYTGGGAHTLNRLPMSRRSQALWFALYGVLVALLCWAAQVAVCLGVGVLFRETLDLTFGRQSLFLAAYSSAYFHSLLPMADSWQMAITLCIRVGMGVGTGLCAFRAWRGERPWWPMAAALCTGFSLSEVGNYTLALFLAIGVVCLAFMEAVTTTEVIRTEKEGEQV